MAEGGRFPWKVQKIRRVPTASYQSCDMQLGRPPAGREWIQNRSTREWTLQPTRESLPVAVPSDHAEGAWSPQAVIVDGAGEGELQDLERLPDSAGRPLLSSIPLAHAEPITTTPKTECFRRHLVNLDLDTFQGICLRYKISALELRQANGFSGTNLKLAPSVLRIPFSVKASKATEAEVVAFKAQEEREQIDELARVCSGLSRMECQAYLSMNEWNTQLAISQALDDLEFESQASKGCSTQSKTLK